MRRRVRLLLAGLAVASGLARPALVRAYAVSLLLSAAARTDPRLRRTGTGYRVDTATPPDPDDQVAALPVLAIADRYGHSTRTGLWCVIDSA